MSPRRLFSGRSAECKRAQRADLFAKGRTHARHHWHQVGVRLMSDQEWVDGGLMVTPGGRGESDILHVRDSVGTLYGTLDLATGRLRLAIPERAMDVTGALRPFYFGPAMGGPTGGEVARLQARAADLLWDVLSVSSPFAWQRAVPRAGRLLVFYCPLARLALEITGAPLGSGVQEEEDEGDQVLVLRLPAADIENDPVGIVEVVSWRCIALISAVPAPTPARPPARHKGWWRRLTGRSDPDEPTARGRG